MLNPQELRETLLDCDQWEFDNFCRSHKLKIHTCSVAKAATMYALLLQLTGVDPSLREKTIKWLQGYNVILHFDGDNRLSTLTSPAWHGPLYLDPKLLESIR